MAQLEFSYSSLISREEDEEEQDAGMVSFIVDFDQEPGSSEFKQTCYSVAMDEVINILSEKYGESVFDNLPDITIRISGLTIS